ncbi:MAG: 6,7-dimethyl-8-ribityllumazine synthase [bacterium]
MAKTLEGQLSAQGGRFGVVISRFNHFISGKLLEGAMDCLRRHGATEEGIEVVWVPGSFEIPMAANQMVQTGRFDALICLGVLIRGETPHFDYIASEATKGIAQVAVASGIPISYGIITAESIEQAIERAGTKAGNKGWDAALSSIEMADLFKQLSNK